MRQGPTILLLFPLTLLAFAGVGVKYLNVVFTTNSRWAFLVSLTTLLLVRRQILLPVQAPFSLALLLDVVWCISTTLWSDAPELSLMKGVAFGLTSWTFVAAGMAWVQQRPGKSALAYLLPMVVLTLFAGFVGSNGAEDLNIHAVRYRGLTGNPNFLGILVAMVLPYALYHAFGIDRRQRSTAHRLILLGIVLLFAILSWWTASRASVLCMLFIGTFFILAADRRRSFRAAIVGGTLAVATIITVPSVLGTFYGTLIIKDDPKGDPLGSRRQSWDESYQHAAVAGPIGIGYGVSAGVPYISGGDTAFWWNLTSVGYGREKGNSQLAVWEETGLIGLALYAILIGQIILLLVRGFHRAEALDARMQIGLLTGAIIGILVQSIVEAWWTSPGSVESALFWSTLGVATGLVRQQRGAVQPASATRRPLLASQAAQ